MYQMYVVIFVFADLLFEADITCAMTFKVRLLEIGTSRTIPCDHVENDHEVRLVQWYKSRRIDEFENGNPSLASWADGATGSLPNYHMEDTTLSLVIGNATLKDEGLYKCSVLRGDLYTESNYYTRTVMYVLPGMNPDITFDTDLNRVHCTVEHVKPVIYPVFDFDYCHASTETYAVLNEDGTFTTSVSCALPPTKSASRVDCSFSYLHHKRVGSLDLRDIITDGLTEEKKTTMSPIGTSVTSAGDGRRTTDKTTAFVAINGIGLLIITPIILAILILLRRRYRAEPTWNRAIESQEKMIASTMVEVTAVTVATKPLCT